MKRQASGSKKPSIVFERELPGGDDYYQASKREILSFNGSLFNETPDNRKIARLHSKITAQETNYHQKRRFIELGGYLSQWFETSILDQVFHLLGKRSDRKEPSEEEEIKKILAYIDILLRLEGNTIRWKTLTEISDYFLIEITRKSLFKYRTEAQKALFDEHGKKEVLGKLLNSSTPLMKRIVTDFITSDGDLNREEKHAVKTGCYHVISAMDDSRFIPRDYEIYSYAIYSLVKKGLTDHPVRYVFPVDSPKFRKSIGNAVYKLKTAVLAGYWNVDIKKIKKVMSEKILIRKQVFK